MPGTGVHLLAADPDLGAGLDGRDRAEAEQLLVVPKVVLPPGDVTIPALLEHTASRGEVLGFVILEGILSRQIELAGRRCSQLLGAGDVVAADDGATLPVPVRLELAVEQRVTLAILDDRFLAACRRWPELLRNYHGRLARAGLERFLHQAIAQLPRVEDRLLATFWCLADRWGSVGPQGVTVDVTLAHQTLGSLIGARRPTVSLGLKSLAESGLLARDDDDRWRLSTDSLDVLAAPATPVPARRPRAVREPPKSRKQARDRTELTRRLQALRDATDEQRARSVAAIERSRVTREAVAARRREAEAQLG